MKNSELRKSISIAGLLYWQVAEELGITDGNFSRLLRHELEGEKRKCVIEAIGRAERRKAKEVEDGETEH